MLALSAGTALAAGCSALTSLESTNGAPTSAQKTENPNYGPPGAPPEADATVKTTPYHGNPLCHVSSSTCMPDEDGYRFADLSNSCEKLAADAGDAAMMGAVSGACRIAREDGGVGVSCSKDADGMGGDGASCDRGGNCAPGFDCVAGENGTKVCRHYCCGGTCKGHMSQNGGATFCDIQSLVDVNQKAPVCMPLKQCKLLGTGECTDNESCAVVTENGATGCVTIGQQQVGASCDEDHCAAKLTCLGQPGSRKCYKLCKVSANDCGTSMVCETSTVFKDPAFGTCQTP